MSQEATWRPILKKLGELHLKQLSLDNNSIANLTPMFSEYLLDLEVFSLGDNFIRYPVDLWDDFMKLKHLKGLNVSWQDKNTEEAALKTALKKPSILDKILSKGMNTKRKIGDICHAMRERRLCLWTASRGSPFRLDFEEAYFNISWSPEMLVPLSGGMALRYRSRALPGSKRVS